MGIYGHKFDKFIKSHNVLENGSPGHPNGDSRMESIKVARNNDKLEADKAKEAEKKKEAEDINRYRKENNMETMGDRQARLAREENIRQAAQKIEGKENWRIQ